MEHSSSNPWDALSDEAKESIRSSLERARRGEKIDATSLGDAHRALPKSVQDLLRDLLDGHDLSIGVDDLWDLIADGSDLADAPPTNVRPTQAPTATASGTPDAASAEPARDVLDRLLQRRNPFERYELREQIGRGGMGTVWRVWDRDLRRHCAMKFLDRADLDDPTVLHRLVRFLEEAQVTGQLEHPGIIPIHEIGLDGERRIYFVMRLVRGRDLSRIFFFVRAGSRQWSITRALGVLQRVCETMAYAHARDVVHRDLKPSNIMVGRFGETYVMDWGIARILTAGAPRDPAGADRSVWTDRQEERQRQHQTPLATQHGDVLGTPAYMSPEQARGDLERIGPLSDVYSCGAILYQLLTGCVPYVGPGERVSNFDILARVLDGPPTPAERLTRAQPPELHAICNKAMVRDPDDRFPSMADMADDIRRYLEGHVVLAHRTGAWVEFRKWVNRNRTVAAALLALIIVLVSAGFVIGVTERRRSAAVVRSLDERSASHYVATADDLWPIHPDTTPAMEQWIVDARALVAKLPDYDAELHRLRARALPYTPEARAADTDTSARIELEHARAYVGMLRGSLEKRRDLAWAPELYATEIAYHEGRIAMLEREVGARRTWRYESPKMQRRHDRLARMVENIRLLGEGQGAGLIAEVSARNRLAAALARHSIEGAGSAWHRAILSIGDASECPRYAGLRIDPQLGLVPLWRDDHSGLWESWHVLSGERPQRDETGRIRVGPDTGIVFVLVPGGAFKRGAQASDPEQPNYDPQAKPAEGPPRDTTLTPYFLSKYELTQGQWFRLTGKIESENIPGIKALGDATPVSRAHPVDQVSWQAAVDSLARWSLTLPTEAQWEFAARRGASSPYWCGEAPECLFGKANFKDQAASDDSTTNRTEDLPDHNDGYRNHAPVDLYESNPYGLYSVLGNVKEWTLDWYSPSWKYVREVAPETGERIPIFSNAITFRGGGFESPLVDLRVTRVEKTVKTATNEDIGVRPCRVLDAPAPD